MIKHVIVDQAGRIYLGVGAWSGDPKASEFSSAIAFKDLVQAKAYIESCPGGTVPEGWTLVKVHSNKPGSRASRKECIDAGLVGWAAFEGKSAGGITKGSGI